MAEKNGAPAWMVSFGDMMTLILTFFILLVSLSKEQQEGLVAQGVGSFLVALRSFGLPGVMNESEKAQVFENVRRKFNLPPEEDAARRTDHLDASNLELIRAKAAKALRPHDELNQPAVARFEPGSTELTDAARRYLDLLATTLRPAPGQVLLLEGHAPTADAAGRLLAFRRAQTVAQYLMDEHGFPRTRVDARAWILEIDPPGAATRVVDARLVIPADED